MDYPALIKRLSHRGLFRIKPGLDRVSEVLAVLGQPQDRIPAIHIAGTNGKGSVAAGLESILRHAGYRTGLYTSPHLHDLRERIQISRQPIHITFFWEVAHTVLDAEKKAGFALTYFEFLTVMAFVAFAKEAVDIAIIETGMGGRLDATNVLSHPLISIITSIGLDHTSWLGHTEKAIAREKAGILKKGTPLISGVRGSVSKVISTLAKKMQVDLLQIDKDFRTQAVQTDWQLSRQFFNYQGPGSTRERIELSLLGHYQLDNAALVLTGIDRLRMSGWTIPDKAISEGLAQVNWLGRFQLLRTQGAQILFDGAHNPPALKRLIETMDQSPWKNTPKTFVFGVYRDKEYQAMFRQVVTCADQIILCTLPGSRSLPAKKILASAKQRWQSIQVVSDPHKALQQALQITFPSNLVVVTGSLALVGLLTQDLAAKVQTVDVGQETLEEMKGTRFSTPIPSDPATIPPTGNQHV